MKRIAVLLIAGFLFVSLAQAEPYNRAKQFGHGWADMDHDGLDTREELIDRDMLLPGEILCEYTGELHSVCSTQAEHVIPLSWAWQHGAEGWSQEQRIAFANDESLLLMVYGPVNQSKGDRGYSEWLPPRIRFIPKYLAMWVAGCKKYNLECDYEALTLLSVRYSMMANGVKP